MLETSSTESAEPRKGVVGVGGGGRNRAKPVDKHESDVVDGGKGRSGDFDMTCQVTRWRPGHCLTAKTIDFDCAIINNRYLLPWIEVYPPGRSVNSERKFAS